LETIGECKLDCLLVASGSVRPSFGNHIAEINSTIDLIPDSLHQENTKILYLSSGAIYGECSTPKSEHDPIAPTTTYGRSKEFAENEFSKIFKNRFSSLRVSNVIDWEMPYGILAMAKKAKEGGVLHLFGESEDCRDYIDISDLCLMIANILELNVTEDVINLGSGVAISLGDFRDTFCSFFPDIDVRWNPAREFDVSRTLLDVSRVKNLTTVSPLDPQTLFEKYLSMGL
jgi:nucleoside-diphosphate-sugar epimerase